MLFKVLKFSFLRAVFELLVVLHCDMGLELAACCSPPSISSIMTGASAVVLSLSIE
jgi:hypothetical protein